MTHWRLILSALIIVIRLIFWPAIQARSVSTLLRNIVIAAAVVIGIPVVLCIAVLSIPFIILLALRNLLIKYFCSKLFAFKRAFIINDKKITINKLAVYQNYAGSMDAFLRSGTKEDEATMGDKDWVLIDDFIHDIWLAKSGQLSTPSLAQLEMSIFNACASISVVVRLKRMNWQDYHSDKKGFVDKALNWLFP